MTQMLWVDQLFKTAEELFIRFWVSMIDLIALAVIHEK